MDDKLIEARRRFCRAVMADAPEGMLAAGASLSFTWCATEGEASVDPRSLQWEPRGSASPVAADLSEAALQALRDSSDWVGTPESADRIAAFCQLAASRFADSPELLEAMGETPELEVSARFLGHDGQGAVESIDLGNAGPISFAPKGRTNARTRLGRIRAAVDALVAEGGDALRDALADVATASGIDIVNNDGGACSMTISVPMPGCPEPSFRISRSTAMHKILGGEPNRFLNLPPDEAMGGPRGPASAKGPATPAP